MYKTQINKTTKVPYKGKNQDILLEVKENNGYKSNEWITYVQARKLGKKLVNAKGKGIGLKTFANDTEKNAKTGKTDYVSRPVSFYVFNTDLIEEKQN